MAYKQLTLRERYEIKAYMQAGISLERISGMTPPPCQSRLPAVGMAIFKRASPFSLYPLKIYE